ncbi:coiled-coil and C2 domain-containing protein 1-like isoform X2 [Rhopilema esculentum]|uniref:coiled-coil and C2 domain-containing protein 1-like isoform X2 n=1 Tax=Rhopilema esculentum TaxID=499914 RepID=UPI0031D87CDA
MFGSKKGKDTKKRENRGNNDDVMKMFGLGMPPEDDDEDDESLEAELAALQGRPVQKKKAPKKNEKLMSLDQIQQLAAASLKDVGDDGFSDEDIDDEDLLDELHDLIPDGDEDVEMAEPEKPKSPSKAPVKSEESGISKVIIERKELYTQAVASAKAEGASSKVRRLERGLKELERLLKEARAGKSVKEDDIPPPVVVKAGSNAPAPSSVPALPKETPAVQPTVTNTQIQEEPDRPATVPSPKEPVQTQISDQNAETLTMLKARRDQYKTAALLKKKEGDVATAKHFLGVFKQFDPVIHALENGQDVDLSKLPPPPDQYESGSKASATAPPTAPASAPQPEPAPGSSSSTDAGETATQDSGLPSAPGTVLEALEQRLEKYNQAAEKAKAEGNGSKARRMGRIVKQYQDAIRDHKKGKPVDYEELPTPPGFAPIPVPGAAKQAAEQNTPAPSMPAAITVAPPQAKEASQPQIEVNAGSADTMSRNQKELQFLLARQKEFKMAALQAKKDGDMALAKDYLRKSKGMDEMVVAAQNGLRVDITTVPSLKGKEKKAPQAAEDNTSIQSVAIADTSATSMTSDSKELYARLEAALRQQVETSKKNSDHYRLLGDLSAAKNFDSLHKGSQQDLDTLVMSKLHGHPVPQFHYEMKSFAIVKSHPELSDSELEITIARCLNVPLPSGYQQKDMYTYVTYEFPFPNDAPQTGSTNVLKGTINPEFNQNFKVSIDRQNRALQRVFRRQPVCFKIMYQRGFLKSDKALGQAQIKMEHFNNRSTIHECVDLMDTDRGRKKVGGKIEIILKIREPLVDKDVDVVNEKWLVLDSHLRTLQHSTPASSSTSMPQSKSPTRQSATGQYKSLEVSKFEKDLTEKQIASYKSQGKSPPPSLIQKLENCNAQLQEAQAILKKGGDTALEYMKQLKTGMEIEKKKAQSCLQSGDKTEARLCLARKKILEKEIASLGS